MKILKNETWKNINNNLEYSLAEVEIKTRAMCRLKKEIEEKDIKITGLLGLLDTHQARLSETELILGIAKEQLELANKDRNRLQDESEKMDKLLQLICLIIKRRRSNSEKIAKIKEVMN
jgi:Trm5-related predicted tRNA methylase